MIEPQDLFADLQGLAEKLSRSLRFTKDQMGDVPHIEENEGLRCVHVSLRASADVECDAQLRHGAPIMPPRIKVHGCHGGVI